MDKIQFNIDKSLKKDFKILTVKNGVEMTEVLTQFISEYVKKHA